MSLKSYLKTASITLVFAGYVWLWLNRLRTQVVIFSGNITHTLQVFRLFHHFGIVSWHSLLLRHHNHAASVSSDLFNPVYVVRYPAIMDTRPQVNRSFWIYLVRLCWIIVFPWRSIIKLFLLLPVRIYFLLFFISSIVDPPTWCVNSYFWHVHYLFAARISGAHKSTKDTAFSQKRTKRNFRKYFPLLQ